MNAVLIHGLLICSALLGAGKASAPGRLFKNRFMGPYDIVVKQIADCDYEGTNQLLFTSNKIRKHNRTTYIYSTVTVLPVPLDDDIKMVAALAVFGNGGWKGNYFRQDVGGVCSAMKLYSPVLSKAIFMAMGYETCPIPPGNYTVSNVVMNMDLKWPSIPYNRYRCDFIFNHKGTTIGCKRFFFDSVPKTEKQDFKQTKI